MDWKRAAAVAGAVACFVAAVALGAASIVSLSPVDQPVLPAQQGLLIETAPALRPFESGGSTPRLEIQPRPQAGAAALNGARAAIREPTSSLLDPPAVQSENRPTSSMIELLPDPPPKVDGRPRPLAMEAAPTRIAMVPKADPKPPQRAPVLSAALPSALHTPNGLLTPSEIRRMRLALRLTREQEVYWFAVEQALLEISAQQSAMVRAGQDPKDAFGIGAGMRIYSVARPLLDQLREDQKAQVRARARAMGFGSIASSL